MHYIRIVSLLDLHGHIPEARFNLLVRRSDLSTVSGKSLPRISQGSLDSKPAFKDRVDGDAAANSNSNPRGGCHRNAHVIYPSSGAFAVKSQNQFKSHSKK